MYRRNCERKWSAVLNFGREDLVSSNHPFHETSPCVFVLGQKENSKPAAVKSQNLRDSDSSLKIVIPLLKHASKTDLERGNLITY